MDSENFASGPIERILARLPGLQLVAVYPVPDARTGDQVMATLSMVEGADFSPEHFAAFLNAQPDLGTKWAPKYVRLVREIPVTATRKIDKMALRRAGWLVEDPVYVRSGGTYAPLTDEAREQLLAEFARYDRLPSAP
ncbi:MAG: hypothetical protein ABI251_15980 [Mycobacteriaceae bacterium]